jgi:hypothetical protein
VAVRTIARPAKTQRTERSRQLTENKYRWFSHEAESRQRAENMDVKRMKAVNVLKTKPVIPSLAAENGVCD